MDCIKTKVFWTVVDTSRVGAFQKWGLRVIEKGFMIDSSCFLIMKRSWHWKLNLGCSKFMLGFVRKYLYHWKVRIEKKIKKFFFSLCSFPRQPLVTISSFFSLLLAQRSISLSSAQISFFLVLSSQMLFHLALRLRLLSYLTPFGADRPATLAFALFRAWCCLLPAFSSFSLYYNMKFSNITGATWG